MLVLAPWNYPYLTAVNCVVPALMAGNAVVLKHSAQTPLCAERFAEAFNAAGLPEGVFQFVHCTHEQSARMIASPLTDFVAFTGSVAGGHAVQRAASDRFIGTGLELGGKDPAYVRHDADLAHAIENLVDGAMFNSGQSCCGIERIYVHEEIYDTFVEGFVELTRQYRLGNPLDANVNLGPMVRARAADFARGQVREAIAAGAQAAGRRQGVSRPTERARPTWRRRCWWTSIIRMRVMSEESFGPVVGIMKVSSDERGHRADERQRVRPHRRDLDRRRGCGHLDRRARRHRHLVHEPLRLSRSGARLDRREGLRPRLHAVGRSATSTSPGRSLSTCA